MTEPPEQVRPAAQRYALQVRLAARPWWLRGIHAVWGLAATVLDGLVPGPSTGYVVVVEPAVLDRVVLRVPVTMDDYDAVYEAMRRDLQRLTAEQFLEEWRSAHG